MPLSVQDLSVFNEGDNETSGVIISKDNETRILLNKKHSPTRQTFTLAHELGHYILHKMQNNQGIKYRIDHYNYQNDSEEAKEETEANYFAATLLVPKDKLEKVLMNAESLDQVARFFGVSIEMIENRMRWIEAN